MKQNHLQKKFKFTAALLSLALLFSVLAVPASAATKSTWITSVAGQHQSTTLWLTATAVEELEATSTSAQLSYIKYCLQDGGGTYSGTEYLYEEYVACEVDANAYAGISKVGSSTIYWYSREDFSLWKTPLKENNAQIDWDTGKITLAAGSAQEQVLTPCAQGSKNSTGGALGLDVAGVNVHGKTAVLIAGGAVAFIVAAKLYDDPTILANARQKAQDFFGGIADTVQGWLARSAPAEADAAAAQQPAQSDTPAA